VAGTDFVPLSGSVVFPAGSTSQTIVITPLNGGQGTTTIVTITLGTATNSNVVGCGEGSQASIYIFDYSTCTQQTTYGGECNVDGSTCCNTVPPSE
jgi:hypothetical protein